jgi:class 3 adenylate cyclase
MVAPQGIVTFLFTDIEGSTKRWEQYPQAMRAALAQHDALLRETIEQHAGYIFQTIGDAFCAAFVTAPPALAAALEAQRRLNTADWNEVGSLKVRMALHSGQASWRGREYFAPHTLNRLSRILSAAHGGQTLLSSTVRELVADDLPVGATLLDLGEHRLRDLSQPEHLYQLNAAGLPADFPPLKTLERLTNLPPDLPPLIGRQREIAALVELLRRPDVRILTLTGAAGSGKTDLSLQVAAHLLDYFPAIYFVPLANVSDPALVVATIASSLEVKESAGLSLLESLKQYVREQQMLLVLDGFEQALDAAPLIAELLTASAELKALVTSREELHLYGEYEFPIAPLADSAGGAAQ